MNRRGSVLPVVLVLPTLATGATTILLVQIAASPTGGGSLATILAAVVMLTGIYGFLLLAYRDLLKSLAKLEDEPVRRREAIAALAQATATERAILREDLVRSQAELAERVKELESRERELWERRRTGGVVQ